MTQREKKLYRALEALVDLYVANRGTESEFISCITPRHGSDMTFRERRKSECWSAWDNAMELLDKQPPQGN
jgi:hypothetical protein